MPLMAALIVWDTVQDGKPVPHKLVVYGLIVLIETAVFGAVWLCSSMNVDADTLNASIIARTEPGTCWHEESGNGLRLLYYMTNRENMAANVTLFPHRYREFMLSLVLLSPVVAFLQGPLFMAAIRSRKGWQRLARWSMPLAVNLMTIPIFFVATDYTRFFVCWFFVQFALPYVLLVLHDRPTMVCYGRMWHLVKNHAGYAICLLAITMALEADSWCGLAQALCVEQYLHPYEI